ncbi:hypothetical protein AKJ62_00665 [candidate division MSBL1 archaeon SCGC-AAA259D14]|uniref:DUF8156 domain-containing protein n=1 Tax=candidate division MSBL1 archaeon SCGC-AAA259D14 TaxID=1698261 RepID=A0A133U8J5_9EURY|nr:hypothetical protein AKJ62_00665 [candidate division MSBL1 archaeon SCGC-AAA259D14]
MGRTVPTYSQVLDKEVRKWREFYNALRRKDREIFDKVIELAKMNRDAGSQMRTPEPFKPMILSILLEQQKELASLRKELEKLKD